MNHIKELHNVLEQAVFNSEPTLDYDDITEGFTLLANLLGTHDEIDWSVGECSNASLDDLIVGAYWHYADYHRGQWSTEYAALCALGEIFQPGMDCLGDNATYDALGDIADEAKTY